MTTSPEVSQGRTCAERAQGVVLRMLEGGAACCLEAWRLGSRYDCVAHGRGSDGQLVVAFRPDPDCLLSTLDAGLGVMVRLDLVRHSREVSLSVVAASAHLMGELVLLSQDQIATALDRGGFPERVAELATVPGARVGVINTDRILVHDHSGVTPVTWDEVRDRRAPQLCEFEAHDAVVNLGTARLRQLCQAVRVGLLAGQATARPSAAGLCAHVRNKVFCVDVDPEGVTLMHIGEVETAVVFAAFELPADTVSALSLELERLVMNSEPVRNQRI